MFASGRRTCMRKIFKNWSMRVEWFEHLSLEEQSVGYMVTEKAVDQTLLHFIGLNADLPNVL